MRREMKRLKAIRERLGRSVHTVVRECGTCGAHCIGDPGPCGAHTLAPVPKPGERVVTLHRSYIAEVTPCRH